MRFHELKIKPEFAVAKINGLKSFEIRLNDRDFQLNDIVRYTCPDDLFIDIVLKRHLYCITYICDFMQKDGYIVFADKVI